MARQFVVLGVTSVLKIPCEADVDSATAALYDSAGTALAGTPSVDVPTVGGLGAAAGAAATDPYVIDVSGGTATPALAPGDVIRVRVDDDASLYSETAVVAAVSPDGSLARLTEPLRYTYGADDEVIGPLSVAVEVDDSLFSEAQALCRCRVVMSHGSSPDTVADVVFDVVKSPVTQPITATSLSTIDPVAMSQLPQGLSDWGPVLERAWDRVLELLSTREIYPAHVIDDSQLLGIHHLAFRLCMAEMGIDPPTSFIQGGALAYFQSQLTSTVDSLRIRWLATEDGTVIDKDETNYSAQPRVRV